MDTRKPLARPRGLPYRGGPDYASPAFPFAAGACDGGGGDRSGRDRPEGLPGSVGKAGDGGED